MRLSRNLSLISALGLVTIIFIGCGPGNGLFGKKTAHEKYLAGLKEADLDNTAMGLEWINAANKSLTSPSSINLPYKETGYFASEKPSAAGFQFTAKRGEVLKINIATRPATGILIFIELWEPSSSNQSPKLLSAADTSSRSIEYESEKEGSYILRIQPELLRGVEYTLNITTAA